MSILTIRLPDDKPVRLRQPAKHRQISVHKLIEELATIGIAEFDAETCYRALASSGNWLTATSGTGAFSPPQIGWTYLEIYDSPTRPKAMDAAVEPALRMTSIQRLFQEFQEPPA